jgi:uridine monophosphate synthetase
MLCMLMITLLQMTEAQLPTVSRAPQEKWRDFLGYKIASPIGISACAATHSMGIRLAARLGCDVLTYKTIRCYESPAHPQPNIAFVNCPASLTHDDIGKKIVAQDMTDTTLLPSLNFPRARPELVEGYPRALEDILLPQFSFHSKPGSPSEIIEDGVELVQDERKERYESSKVDNSFSETSLCSSDIAIANSFGNQSMDPDWVKNDIQKAKQSLLPGQVLIVSVFGNTHDEWIKAAQLAVEGGADIIEANFSCPNLKAHNQPVYTRPDDIFSIAQTLVQSLPKEIPLILKFGVFADHHLMRQTLIAAAQAGARGICGINTIPMKVVNADGAPTFGNRIFAGVSGAPIQKLALDFIKNASIIIHQENLNLVLLAVGGIMKPSHFSQFLRAGATIALSATGMMYNPDLAARYHEQQQIQQIDKQNLANKLFDIGVIKFGEFVFKSGIRSNNYVDMRLVISYPDILQDLAVYIDDILQQCNADVICGVPYAAVPVTTAVSLFSEIPMLMARPQAKDHGTKKMVEGVYCQGQQCVMIEDVLTTGGSVLETIKTVEAAGLQVKNVIGIIDRQQGARENITAQGYNFHALFTLQEWLSLLKKSGRITQETYDMVCASCQQTKRVIPQENVQQNRALTYQERVQYCVNPIAKRLLNIIETKKSNLVFSIDVTSKAKLLELADLIGPEICVLKTHCDIVDGFDQEFFEQLRALAHKHNFLIFEDRKFADIGSTTVTQYTGGVLKIADWADIVTVHAVAGDGTIQALKSTPETKDAACLLIAQMSSANTLTKDSYTQETIKFALEYPENVIGFICREKLSDNPGILHFTTGVQLGEGGDALGQQYLDPYKVINQLGSDIIIVGRGILNAKDPLKEAQRYQKAGWDAYEQRINQ